MPIERPDWGSPAAGAGYGGRETAGAEPPAPEDKRAESAAEDLTVTDAEDADDSALHRRLLADGVFTPAELRRVYGLSAEEVEALSKPKVPSRQSIEQEIASIQKDMKDNRQAYFKDEKKQA